MVQPASKVSQEVPKQARLGPTLLTLEALLATWGVPLRIFTHFYQVFVSICVFLLKIHGKPTKILHIAAKIMNVTQNT